MKILHLRLANYRGIEECKVRFGPKGITVVEGPNETGKTSLREALALLFEYLDSSKHQNVVAVRPVHRDAGPEIELQAETGPYVFTYFKRFHGKPETTLKVTRPNPENHTGRDAHERAEAILHETIDIDLWKALSIQQGEAISQANLSKQTALSAALDKAAGGHSTDPREDSLFDRVWEEYGRYFTAGGSEKKELQEVKKSERGMETEVDSLERQLQDLEKDIDRAADLQLELGRSEKQKQELEEAVAEYMKSLEEIKDLESVLETAQLKLDSAQKSEQVERQEKERRQELIDTADEARKAHAELEGSSKSSVTAVEKAQEELEKASLAETQAEKRRREADSLLDLRHADLDYYNDKLHLDLLKERKKRIDNAREKAALAEELLAKNRVDGPVLKKIQNAERALVAARAQLQAGAPTVLLHGLTDLAFHIDGKKATIGRDEEQTLSVPDRVRLTIPKTLDVEVTAGSSAADLSKKVEEAQRTLEVSCKDAGVRDPDEALSVHDERQEALRHLENKDQVERDDLRDLTYEQLGGKIIGLNKRVAAYPSERVREPELCPDLQSTKKERLNAKASLHKANREWEPVRETLDTARQVRDKLREKHQKVGVELDLKATEFKRAEARLARARKSVHDDVLESNLTKSLRAVRSEEKDVRSAEAILKEGRPEQVKTLAETTKGSLQTVKNKHIAVQTEFTEVRTRLKVLGEDGLHEKVQAAQSRLEHISQEKAAMIRMASAAKLLFEIMREERDKARHAYVAPLKEKIEHFGRLIFNDSLQVEVSEDLSIMNRTLDDITVPFDSLSGGAQEQLSLIFRLACAMTVAKDGGAPVILDDALGYTDPERLKLMGAVLAKAGQECQIIILTCVPDRYSNIGEATVVRLG